MNEEDNNLLVARYYNRDELREFYAEGFREEGREEGEKKNSFCSFKYVKK